jgi:Family of unknown function (DUF6491)
MSRLIPAALAAALACAPAAASAAEKPGSDQACFSIRSLRGHTNDGVHTLYLDVGGRSVYRLETRGGCLSTGSPSEKVVLQSRSPGGQICSALDVDLTVHGARCVVDAVTRLTPQELAAVPRQLQPQGRLSIEPPPDAGADNLSRRGAWVVGIHNANGPPR